MLFNAFIFITIKIEKKEEERKKNRKQKTTTTRNYNKTVVKEVHESKTEQWIIMEWLSSATFLSL